MGVLPKAPETAKTQFSVATFITTNTRRSGNGAVRPTHWISGRAVGNGHGSPMYSLLPNQCRSYKRTVFSHPSNQSALQSWGELLQSAIPRNDRDFVPPRRFIARCRPLVRPTSGRVRSRQCFHGFRFDPVRRRFSRSHQTDNRSRESSGGDYWTELDGPRQTPGSAY